MTKPELQKTSPQAQAISAVVLILLLAFAFFYFNSNFLGFSFLRGSNQPIVTPSTTESPAPTQPANEKLTIFNTSFSAKAGYSEVVGEIKNNDGIKHIASLKATFYDVKGKIIGVAIGTVSDLAPGETKTINLMTTDSVAGYATMKVQVDALL